MASARSSADIFPLLLPSMSPFDFSFSRRRELTIPTPIMTFFARSSAAFPDIFAGVCFEFDEREWARVLEMDRAAGFGWRKERGKKSWKKCVLRQKWSFFRVFVSRIRIGNHCCAQAESLETKSCSKQIGSRSSENLAPGTDGAPRGLPLLQGDN